MIDVKDTRTIVDSLRRCCHIGPYAGTAPGETCDNCTYSSKCSDLELDAAELILLLDELTDHQFEINRDIVTDLRHCNGCSEFGYSSRCRVHDMHGSSGCSDKLQEFAADILEKMYSRYRIKHALECQNRPFFVKLPNGTWEPINERIEPPIDTYPVDMYPSTLIACDGFRGGKIYDVKTISKEDIKDVMDATTYFASIVNQIKELDRKRFETSFTPKSIEQSADHKTVCVLWQDGSKTIVKLSDNDKDDIDTAFTYALAKKIFGTNTHLKKVVRQKLNEHKPKNKEPKIVAVEETPYGTVQHYSDGDYSIISNQTQSGLFDHLNKENENG